MSVESQVIRAFATVLEMCADRGWDTTAARAVGDAEVAALASERHTFGVNINETDRAVFHVGGVAIKKQDVFAAAGPGARRIVLVARQKLTSATLKALAADAAARGAEVQPFTLEEMQFNVSRHSLQPRFSLMAEAEETEVLRALGVSSRALLPVILPGDPMARYLGLRRGQLVRIVRRNQTSGESVNYRCCA